VHRPVRHDGPPEACSCQTETSLRRGRGSFQSEFFRVWATVERTPPPLRIADRAGTPRSAPRGADHSTEKKSSLLTNRAESMSSTTLRLPSVLSRGYFALGQLKHFRRVA
jgi:hypothetical protein